MGLRNARKVAYKHLTPMIEERRRILKENGEEDKKPVLLLLSVLIQNDFLQWLMDYAKGIEARPDYLALRMQLINFASIHSTTVVRCLLNNC